MANPTGATNAAPTTPVSSTPVVPATPNQPVAGQPQSAGTTAAVPSTATPEVFGEVTIDGKKEKKTLKELTEAYQLRQLSDRKRAEADKVLAEYKRLQTEGAKDPIKLMRAMGFDFDSIATKYLAQKAEESMKSPEVREAERLKQENEQYKQWVEQQKTNMEKATREKAVQVERERIHKEIVEAIEEKKELGFPIDEHLIIQIAQDMMVQDKAKKPLNAKEALPQTYARTQKWLQGLASKMEGEAIVKWLGEDVAKKIRKYDLQQLKAKRAPVSQQTGSAVKPKVENKQAPVRPYKTWSEFKRDSLDTLK